MSWGQSSDSSSGLLGPHEAPLRRTPSSRLNVLADSSVPFSRRGFRLQSVHRWLEKSHRSSPAPCLEQELPVALSCFRLVLTLPPLFIQDSWPLATRLCQDSVRFILTFPTVGGAPWFNTKRNRSTGVKGPPLLRRTQSASLSYSFCVCRIGPVSVLTSAFVGLILKIPKIGTLVAWFVGKCYRMYYGSPTNNFCDITATLRFCHLWNSSTVSVI